MLLIGLEERNSGLPPTIVSESSAIIKEALPRVLDIKTEVINTLRQPRTDFTDPKARLTGAIKAREGWRRGGMPYSEESSLTTPLLNLNYAEADGGGDYTMLVS